MSTNIIQIPSKLVERLNEEHKVIILENLIPFAHLLRENKLYFFPDYTDHGINHIEGVLNTIENLIDDKTIEKLSSLDVCAIIIATVLHDIGMHTNLDMFKKMINGEYDYIPDNFFTETTWKELWYQYLKDSQFWNQEKIENVVGKKDYTIKEPDLDNLTVEDRKYIGEFIRIHHPRLAYEIALNGYQGHDASIGFNFEKNEKLKNKRFLQISGLIARSHGMNVRDTFKYLKKISGEKAWKKPIDIKVVFLMTLIRIADYLQIESDRTDELMIKLRPINSPYSKREHETHLAIDNVQLDNDDKELIYVEATPENAKMYVKIDHLIQDIQKEFDQSWAIIGEVYSDKYKLKYRRIMSNLSEENLKESYTFVPQQFGFKFNGRLTGLLIAPLYGDDPKYGVRELVQNAVDACRTRMADDKKFAARNYKAHVTVSINSKTKHFKIVDKGIGMTIEEIEKYFLTIGSSYNDSTDWKKTQNADNATTEISSLYRTGRFGIGILAAFLLGKEITVKTRSIKGKQQGYQFTLSLDQNFIQIDKVEGLDFGTTIEIVCNEKVFEDLAKNRRSNWCNWYIDTKPIVKYSYDGEELIPESTDVKKDYNKLEYESKDFGEILWKHRFSLLFYNNLFIDNLCGRPKLYCNGFLINDYSDKRNFTYFHEFEKYLPLRMPGLIVSDIHNLLPLNLKRDEIDENVTYPFEKELAIAQCKDALCQLLVIDIKDFRYTHHFFFNSAGFTINCGRFIKSISAHSMKMKDVLYEEKCLQDKKLIHIIEKSPKSYRSKNNSAFLSNVLNLYPDAFISFCNKEDIDQLEPYHICFYHVLASITYNFREDAKKTWVIALHRPRISLLQGYEDINHILKNLVGASLCKNYGEYYLVSFSESINISIAKEIIDHADKKPLAICIYDNTSQGDSESDLDGFFAEYAGGDMMIPYDEEERHKKFAKLYEECADDIERYKKIYNNSRYKI